MAMGSITVQTGKPRKKPYRYFLDTEFIEGFRRPLFGKKRHVIDLISIGIVCERGKRSYYAVSKDFDPGDASEWVVENVLRPIVDEYVQSFHGDQRNHILDLLEGKSITSQVKFVQKHIGKSNKQIADELRTFIYGPALAWGDGMLGADADVEAWLERHELRFYGYYSDYDWVVFCSLFGAMDDLPTGFPYYCRDLQQLLDEKDIDKDELKINSQPQPNEHNALADAKWNATLFHEIRFTPATSKRLDV